MNGGTVDVHIENPDQLKPSSLLDTRVLLTGVSGGRFDGKFHLIGSNLYLSSAAGLRVMSRAPVEPSALPLHPDQQNHGHLQRGRAERARASPRQRHPL